mmetsp:Transcript_29088/g.64054  ORF Transcript_29088/g.64054 Transcript_29088/m.64054 type:complete len:391 (+) Transcript_29088:45-1217(+)
MLANITRSKCSPLWRPSATIRTIANARRKVVDTLDASSQVDPRGGGEAARAINEKVRTGEPPREFAGLVHSLYGMHEYPGYLEARFAPPPEHEDRLRRLRDSLDEKRAEVDEALKNVEARRQLLQSYKPRHATDILLKEPREIVDEALATALRSGGPLPEELVTEESPGVFSFQLLDSTLCHLLVQESSAFLDWSREQQAAGAPGSEFLQTGICVVDHLGKAGEHVLNSIFELIMQPLSARLFAETGGASLDYRYGYIIGYGNEAERSKDRSIVRQGFISHIDDSEVTLNVCLRNPKQFTGGRLMLQHLRGSSKEGQLEKTMELKLGRAVMHRGVHMHEVEGVTSGQRQVLIMWTRSSEFRAATCPCVRQVAASGAGIFAKDNMFSPAKN